MRRKLLLGGIAVTVLIAAVFFWNRYQAPTTPAELPQPSLAALAKQRGIELGVYVARDRMDEHVYMDIARDQFGFVVIDGQPNWQFEDGQLRPGPDQYDYSRIDQVLAFAKAHNKPVRMHHFVWGEEKWLPDWLKNSNYTEDQVLDLMRQHILTVGEHYKDDVREWTVVNEAFTRGLGVNGLRDWWKDATGGQEYISRAFRWAREADPDAILILNDFGNEVENTNSNAMYEYVKKMKADNVPIDAIGMQMHIDGTKPPSKEDVIANMKRFAELGVKVYVTEFDVNMNDVAGDEGHKEREQARIYHEMLRACIESRVCPSFAYLGITDKESWYNEMGVPNAMPLFFDRDYQPKPAFYSMRDALSM
jgi:endo-1,4-beta-xylanase